MAALRGATFAGRRTAQPVKAPRPRNGVRRVRSGDMQAIAGHICGPVVKSESYRVSKPRDFGISPGPKSDAKAIRLAR